MVSTGLTAGRRRMRRRGRHPEKALSAAFIRTAPPGRHADGNGLYLFVQPVATRSWIQRIVIRGRRREMGLGSVALVSLAEARELALANRKLVRSGGDPLADRCRAEGVPTSAKAARRVKPLRGWVVSQFEMPPAALSDPAPARLASPARQSRSLTAARIQRSAIAESSARSRLGPPAR